MNNPLPPEVLALLGDDATPEKAAVRHAISADVALDLARGGRVHYALYDAAIAADAIRECEARRKHSDLSVVCSTRVLSSTPDEMRSAALARDVAATEELEAIRHYDALRNWRNP